jgi:hypothetical protein
MEVDQNTRLQPGQDLQDDESNIAVNLDDVRPIDKKDIVSAQFAKKLYSHDLNGLGDHTTEARKSPTKDFAGIRIDRDELCVVALLGVSPNGSGGHVSRKPGPDLDDTPGPIVTNHTIIDPRVYRPKHHLIEIVLIRCIRRASRKGFILRPIRTAYLFQKRPLTRFVHIQADEIGGPGP